MHLIVITSPHPVPGEERTINGLFSAGLERLHIRKPGYNEHQMRRLLQGIKPCHHPRLVLHSHHRLTAELGAGGHHFPARDRKALPPGMSATITSTSCHSGDEAEQWSPRCDHIFLSPVFHSISKPGYRAGFSAEELDKLTGRLPNLVALGGVDATTIRLLFHRGWYGAAVLGGIWNHGDHPARLAAFQELHELVSRQPPATGI